MLSLDHDTPKAGMCALIHYSTFYPHMKDLGLMSLERIGNRSGRM